MDVCFDNNKEIFIQSLLSAECSQHFLMHSQPNASVRICLLSPNKKDMRRLAVNIFFRQPIVPDAIPSSKREQLEVSDLPVNTNKAESLTRF